MMHAILIEGSPVILARVTYTAGNVNYSAGTLDGMSRAEKLAIGVYEVMSGAIPDGQRAVSWNYAVAGDFISATPTLEAAPVAPTIEEVVAALAPPAANGEGLAVGRYYAAGQTVTEGGTTYEVIQPFFYASPGWTVASLAAHLVAAPSAVWGPSTAYGVGDVVEHLGVSYAAIQAHTSQVGWEPPNVPALWGAV